MTTCRFESSLPAMLAGTMRSPEETSIMAHVETCPRCQEALEQLTAVPRLAPKSGEHSPDLPLLAPPEWPVIPGYEIQSQLGKGGMAVVYKALDVRLNRPVALKMLLADELATAEERLRLGIEGETLALLRHPNIVQIYTIGTAGKRHFLAMELVAGGNLAQELAGRPWPAKKAAALLRTLARAIHHAHQYGIIHRDLKPANVLLQRAEWPAQAAAEYTGITTGADRDGAIPKISDFGLARQQHHHLSMTATGLVVGTPSYVAPEQACGQKDRIGPAADVYSLGAMLYEVLTGRPPFQGTNTLETLSLVLNQEPVPITDTQPATPRDLETICFKCLNKEPAKRYSSALELADDLDRFLNGRPIHARPIGFLERGRKWVKRRPAAASLLAASVLLTALSFTLLWREWRWADQRAATAAKAKTLAELNERQERAVRREVEVLSTRTLLEHAQASCEAGEIGRGLLRFVQGLEMAVHAGDHDLERLARLNLSAWRPYLVREQAELRHGTWVWAVAFGPQGMFATGDKDGLVRLWDASGKALGTPLRHRGSVWAVAFSPNGKLLLVGTGADDRASGEAHLWDVARRTRIGDPLPHKTPIREVSFGADGNGFLTVCPPEAHLWRLQLPAGANVEATQIAAQATLEHPGGALAATFNPTGSLLASGGRDSLVRLWDGATGKPSDAAPLRSSGPVEIVAFSPDGQTVAAAARVACWSGPRPKIIAPASELRFWRLGTGPDDSVICRPEGWVKSLAFRRDGLAIVTGSALFASDRDGNSLTVVGGAARLWRVDTGAPLCDPLPHPHALWSAVFSPDDRMLLTGCEDTHARLFRLTQRSPTWTSAELMTPPMLHEGTVRSVVVRDDGHYALTASAGGDAKSGAAARLWKLPNDDALGRILPGAHGARALAFSGDGQHLIAATGREAHIWEIATEKLLPAAVSHDGIIDALAFSPIGEHFATAGADRNARLWQWPSGRLLYRLDHDQRVPVVCFDPDGRLLVTVAEGGALRIYDVATGKCLAGAREHQGDLTAFYFTRGEIRWIEQTTGAVRLWKRASNGSVRRLWQADVDARSTAFSPDGQSLLVFTRAHTLEWRDARTGRSQAPALSLPPGLILWLPSPDRRIFLTTSHEQCRLWDTAARMPFGPPLRIGDIDTAVFRPDGEQVALAGAKQTTMLWPIATPMKGKPEQVRAEIEAMCGPTSLPYQRVTRPD